ncbi:MAG: hypothetical protein IJK30_05315 [Ruminococcus sp.]|nr:hypothetical protein [Ruminococcus sp.]
MLVSYNIYKCQCYIVSPIIFIVKLQVYVMSEYELNVNKAYVILIKNCSAHWHFRHKTIADYAFFVIHSPENKNIKTDYIFTESSIFRFFKIY